MLEELHALGAKRFVVFGNCGVLNQQIEGGPRTKHGGDDDSDNSGIIRYVRVEFAGYPFMKDKEINGITFGSVGSGTTIDHLQVSYSNDDSYECRVSFLAVNNQTDRISHCYRIEAIQTAGTADLHR